MQQAKENGSYCHQCYISPKEFKEHENILDTGFDGPKLFPSAQYLPLPGEAYK